MKEGGDGRWGAGGGGGAKGAIGTEEEAMLRGHRNSSKVEYIGVKENTVEAIKI